jgi:hypothetical protein
VNIEHLGRAEIYSIKQHGSNLPKYNFDPFRSAAADQLSSLSLKQDGTHRRLKE